MSEGGSNRYADLVNNPGASFQLLSRRFLQFPLKIEDTHKIKMGNLIDIERERMLTLVGSVAKSYKYRLGNCGESSALALYFATKISDELLAASTVFPCDLDHEFIKLVFKNYNVLYVDPWFLNKENSGAIIDPDSLDMYLKTLLPDLCLQAPIQLLSTLYAVRSFLVALFAFAVTQDVAPKQIFYSTIAALLMTIIGKVLEEAGAYTISHFNMDTGITLEGETFKLFNDLCNTNIYPAIPSSPTMLFRELRVQVSVPSSSQQIGNELSPKPIRHTHVMN